MGRGSEVSAAGSWCVASEAVAAEFMVARKTCGVRAVEVWASGVPYQNTVYILETTVTVHG